MSTLLSVAADLLMTSFEDFYEKGTGERWNYFLAPLFAVLIWWGLSVKFDIVGRTDVVIGTALSFLARVANQIDFVHIPEERLTAEFYIDSEIIGVISTCLCTLLTLLGSHLLSFLIMKWIQASSVRETVYLDYSSYEKREQKYYLKLKKIYLRQFIAHFEKKSVLLIVIIMEYLYLHKAEEPDGEAMLQLIQGLTLWVHQKAVYLNSKTWEEEKSWKKAMRKSTYLTNRDIYGMVEHKEKYEIQAFCCFLSQECTVQRQSKLFPSRYSEMFGKLKEEKSVLVTNAFYHDWERALFLPLHRFLLNERRVIILAGAHMDTSLLKTWVERELGRMLGIAESWRVRIWEQGMTNWDILIVNYEDIPSLTREITVQKESIHGLFMLVLEPSRMVLEMKPYLEYMADDLKKMETPPVYCFADREMTGLLDCLSHIFRTKIEGVSIDWQNSRALYCYGVDESKRGDAEKNKGPIHYLGKGAEISERLMKTEEKVCYASDGIEPVKDIQMALKSRLMSQQMEHKDWVKGRLNEYQLTDSFWEIQNDENGCMIVNDGMCHFYEMGRLLAGRKRGHSHLFILSGEYLLRRYMWDNAKTDMFKKNVVPVFFPIYRDTERNRLIQLLYRGQQQLLNQADVIQAFPDYVKEQSAFTPLEQLGREQLVISSGSRMIRQKSTCDWGLDEKFAEENQWWMGEVYLIDEKKDRNILGCRRMGQVYQHFLPGQYLCLRGCYYMLLRVERPDDQYLLILRRSSSFARQADNYHQQRTYYVHKSKKEATVMADACFQMESWRCGIYVKTSGYVEKRSVGGGGFIWVENRKFNFTIPVRKYKKKVLHLFIQGDGIDMREIDQVYEGLAILLTEMARTIFPYHYQYLAVLPLGMRTPELHDILYDLKLCGVEKAEREGILILEDCMEDIGLLDTIALHWQMILGLCRRYCQWASESKENYFGCDQWKTNIDTLKNFLDGLEPKTVSAQPVDLGTSDDPGTGAEAGREAAAALEK